MSNNTIEMFTKCLNMASFASKVGKNDINQSLSNRNEVTEDKTRYFRIDEFATYNFRTQHFLTHISLDCFVMWSM